MSRDYTQEFKDEAVKLVLEEGYGTTEAANRLGVPPSTVNSWVRKARKEQLSGGDKRSQSELLAKIKLLEKENKKLAMERDILKKATAFFAKENN